MIARPIPVRTGEEAVRVVRALGGHRYVKAHLHVVHALVFEALAGETPELAHACEWARSTLSDPSVEVDSKDPRLYRHATPEELAQVLSGFWTVGASADRAHERLLSRAHALGLDMLPHPPFDESAEDDIHPLLVDAGWELTFLSELDAVRHRGVIEAYDEPIAYEAAAFEEDNAVPKAPPLQELPAIGLVELLRGVDADGDLVEPLVLWTHGDEVYQDYLLRGVLKVAKITPPT